MTNQHPVTPPPELVQQWINEEDGLTAGHIANRAAQWGADQELEACCEWLRQKCGRWATSMSLRAARRPKPQSLKEQALKTLKCLESESPFEEPRFETIRRALEALPDD